MSDQAKMSGRATPVAAVPNPDASLEQSLLPTLQSDTEYKKRSKAPAIPNKELAGDIEESKAKDLNSVISQNKTKNAPVAEKQSATKKQSPSPTQKSNEALINNNITLATVQVDNNKSNLSTSQPIPPAVPVEVPKPDATKDDTIEENSVNDLVPELQPTSNRYDWSDEELASGLPRSQSRASRVSRAVRQLFCCGYSYDAPSEDNISAASEKYAV